MATIKTKYDIGNVFYRPKSVKRVNKQTVEVDGHEYERNVDYFSPEVDTIEIMEINATVDGIGEADVVYRCRLKNDTVTYFGADNEGYAYFPLRVWRSEDLDKCATTYGRAKEIAIDYAVHKKREFSIAEEAIEL
jgi:hypothetical protein